MLSEAHLQSNRQGINCIISIAKIDHHKKYDLLLQSTKGFKQLKVNWGKITHIGGEKVTARDKR